MSQPPAPSRRMTDTIKAKSNQLNADDLVGGCIIVDIKDVTVNENPTADQPVTVHLSGGFCPWKPCKTERRVLVAAWGDDGAAYIGRRLKLFRDNGVTWAGAKVGGIRIEAMSHLTGQITISLAVSKGKKAPRHVVPLSPEEGGSVDPFRGYLIAATKREVGPWTLPQIRDWLLSGRQAAEVPSYERPAILERLQGPPSPPPAPSEEEAL